MTYTDNYARPINYLRVSVTDLCNLRCVYCMPEEGVPKLSHDNILRFEEIVRIVRVAVDMGIIHVRLTGGEPLVRRGIVDLVAELGRLPGLDDLSMTTNGTLLSRFAASLAQAGLDRINISLDTLQPERFRHITRRGELEDVLYGRRAALDAGLRPVKINTVVVRGLNEERLGPLTAVTANGPGPARYYQLPGAEGTLGFISPISEHFCHACNRLRLTSDGRLLPCLLSNTAFDMRTPLRAGATDEELRELLVQTINAKPRGHHLAETVEPTQCTPMSQIGG